MVRYDSGFYKFIRHCGYVPYISINHGKNTTGKVPRKTMTGMPVYKLRMTKKRPVKSLFFQIPFTVLLCYDWTFVTVVSRLRFTGGDRSKITTKIRPLDLCGS